MTVIFQIALGIIAGIVAYGIYKKENMWQWIFAYWTLLTVKYIVEFIGEMML